MGLVKGADIRAASGKMGVLLPGMGAVGTTFIAGVMNIRRGLATPIGSLTQMGAIRLGKRTDNRSPKISEFVPLAGLNDLVFGGWDIFGENAYQAAVRAGVLTRDHLDPIKEELSAIKPMPAVFEQEWVKRLTGDNVKKGKSKADFAEQLIADIADFKKKNNLRPLRRGLVRLDRDLPHAGPGARHAGDLRKGAARERSRRSRPRRSTPTRA